MQPIGHDGFDVSMSFEEITVTLCSSEIPDDMSNVSNHHDDFGIDYSMTDVLAGTVPKEYLACFNGYIQIPGGFHNNVLTFPEKYGVLLGSPSTTDLSLMGHLHVHGPPEQFLGKPKRWTIRMFHTNKLRPYAIGFTFAGSLMSTFGVVVPPKAQSFTTVGFCHYRCLEKVRHCRFESSGINNGSNLDRGWT